MDGSLAFAVSLAGPTVSVSEQILHDIESSVRCSRGTDEDVADALAREEAGQERKIAVGSWFPFFQLRYSANILQYDPREAIGALTMPTMLAFGGNDPLVPIGPNLERFAEIFPGGAPDNFTWNVVSGGDHAFHVTHSACVGYEEALAYPYSQEFVTTLGAWIDDLEL